MNVLIWLRQSCAGEVARHEHLVEVRRAQHGGLGGQHEPVAHGGRHQRPADPQPGGERLGERPEVDDVAVHRAQRRVDAAGEAEQPVRVVLHHRDAVCGADLQDLGPALDGERDAGGVVEVRDRVEELRGDPLRGERVQRLAQQFGDEAVLVHRDVDDARLVGGEAARARRRRTAPRRSRRRPGRSRMRVTRSRAICEPTVTTTSSGSARMPSRAITSQICSRSAGTPWAEPYCSATWPSRATRSATSPASASSGSAARLGIPPASETTSGRLATANSARISDAVMPAVRAANRSAGLPRGARGDATAAEPARARGPPGESRRRWSAGGLRAVRV